MPPSQAAQLLRRRGAGDGKGQILVHGKVVRTVPESQIVETLIDEAMRIADQMTENGTDAGMPEVSVF